MPTRRSMEAAGYSEQEISQATAKYVCYVCGDPLEGLVNRDTPSPEDARKGVALGERHRDCPPSEDAAETKKVMLAWRQETT